MHTWNKSRIGTVETVLIENIAHKECKDSKEWGENGDKILYVRSYAESPEVDGYIKVNLKNSIDNFETPFIKVKITRIEDGELVGEPI
jgi:hypothetical protein